MATAQVNGVELHYEIIGEGEPLLAIMGLGAQMLLWPDDFCRALAGRGFQVIRFDNRDIGLSTKTPGPPPTTRSLLKAMATRSTTKATYRLADMGDETVYGPELHLFFPVPTLVRTTFRLAFWELFHAPHFEAGLIDVVNRGGDVLWVPGADREPVDEKAARQRRKITGRRDSENPEEQPPAS